MLHLSFPLPFSFSSRVNPSRILFSHPLLASHCILLLREQVAFHFLCTFLATADASSTLSSSLLVSATSSQGKSHVRLSIEYWVAQMHKWTGQEGQNCLLFFCPPPLLASSLSFFLLFSPFSSRHYSPRATSATLSIHLAWVMKSIQGKVKCFSFLSRAPVTVTVS